MLPPTNCPDACSPTLLPCTSCPDADSNLLHWLWRSDAGSTLGSILLRSPSCTDSPSCLTPPLPPISCSEASLSALLPRISCLHASWALLPYISSDADSILPLPPSFDSHFFGLSINKYMHITMGNRRKSGNKGIKICSWNCGGGFITKSKKAELEKYMKENYVDMMAVSEVDITNTSFFYEQLYHIDGYKMIFPPSWGNNGKARIICYYRDGLENFIKIRPDLSPLDQPVIWLQVNSSPSFLVAFVYREWTSITGDKSLRGQQTRLNEILSKASTVSNHEVIIMGDVNINGLRLRGDPGEDKVLGLLKEFMLEHGFEQLVQQPTRSRVANGILEESLLDHILTNNKPNTDNVETIEMSNSDHDIISMRRKTRRPLVSDPITVRSFKNFDETKFLKDLEAEQWEPVETEGSVDVAVDFFNAAVHRCLEKHAPKITFQPRIKSNPMLSPTTIRTIRERDSAKNRAKRTKDPLDVDIHRNLRNKVVGMIKKDSKAATYLACSTSRGTWAALGKLTRENKARHGPPTELKFGDETVTDKQKMANALNDFFIDKVVKLREKIKDKQQPYDPILHLKRLLPPNLPVLDLKSVTASDVASVLSAAKNSSSVGPDDLSYKVLKAGSKVLAGKLASIFNKSLETGVFPRLYRQALVVPLHKKKSKIDPANYRNISLVSKQALTFEKLIQKQIAEHFGTHNLFSPSQHAYIMGRSTSTLCTTIYDRACRAAQLGKFAGILSCDLKSGFDVISGKILADKLHEGFCTSLATDRWLRSYLSERYQQVRLGEVKSNLRRSASSLGQGSVLAPLFFSIAIIDLPAAAVNGNIDIFADDINDTVVDKSAQVVVAKLQEDAEAIENWLRANQICLAEDKTTLMLSSNKERKRDELTKNLAVTMDGKIIRQSSVIKVLGVLFSEDLTFSSHIHGDGGDEKGLISSLSGILGSMKRFSKFPAAAKKMFLTSTFNSKLYYGIETYGALPNTSIRQLQCIQNRAAFLALPNRNLSAAERISALGWLQVSLMIEKASLCLLHKLLYSHPIPYFAKMIGSSRRRYFDPIPTYDQSLGRLLQRSFLPRTAARFNSLPEDMRKCSPNRFKKLVGPYLRANPSLT